MQEYAKKRARIITRHDPHFYHRHRLVFPHSHSHYRSLANVEPHYSHHHRDHRLPPIKHKKRRTYALSTAPCSSASSSSGSSVSLSTASSSSTHEKLKRRYLYRKSVSRKKNLVKEKFEPVDNDGEDNSTTVNVRLAFV
ncbi:hypothetical protein BC829DRAFT_379833 [Chytridium lagenaria]|nr:hypothetical protein BC829DRAFT_379833 [Chytridium lagenaria]